MTETAEAAAKSIDSSSFSDVLKAMVGQVVTVVNPESFEDAPMGSRLTTGFYRAKLLAVGSDFISLATEFHHKKGDKAKEPVKQFIPFTSIKRLSVMKSDKLIHI
jgi:hypothetical protein